MRAAIVGFIAGVSILESQPDLPNRWGMIALVLATLAMLRISRSGHEFLSSDRYKSYKAQFIAGLHALTGLLIGVIWAALIAHGYLSQKLPKSLEGQDLVVVGVVDSLPYRFDQGVRFNLRVEKATQDGVAVSIPEHIALGWYAGMHGYPQAGPAVVQPGERWHLIVRLQRPHGNANPDGFDYELWLLEQNIRATGQVRVDTKAVSENRMLDSFVPGMRVSIERMRGMLRDKIVAALPESQYAGVLVALVIGDQRAVAQSDWKIFNRTGIGHLVSISGLHITMIAGLFASVMHLLWRRSFFTGAQLPLILPAQKVAALTAAIIALLYVLLAGFGVPAQRTLYMLWVVAAALWSGRIGSISHVLCIAAAVVVLFDPWAVLWPGFWLSFGAVAIILYASIGRAGVRLPSHPTRRHRVIHELRTASYTQYVVTLGLVPLTVLLFGQVSLVSPLANAIAIPLVSLLVAPMALAGAFLPVPLSGWLLTMAHALVVWLAAVLTWLSELPYAVVSSPISPFWMFCCALIGALWLLAPRGWPVRWLGIVAWFPIMFNTATFPQRGGMTVTAFDVGQGMGLLIETASHRLLYDTGPFHSPTSNGGNRVIIPYLKSRGIDRLDGVVISHNDNDHSGGALSIFEEIKVDWTASSLAADSPIVLVAPDHIRCEAGQYWRWDDIDFEILHPGTASYDSPKTKPNGRSCTLKITTANHTLLLPGDIETSQENDLVARIPDKLKADILLAPHHGSGTSSTLPFLAAVEPKLAIFQVGYRNRYRHPKTEIYERYKQLGIKRLRSDDSGAITLKFGETVTMQEYRVVHGRYWYAH
jgi:competence protein ComEC